MKQGRFLTVQFVILFFIAFTSAVVVFLYWKGLNGPFLLDDYVNLQPMVLLSQGKITLESFVFPSADWVSSRPLSLLSFVASQYLSGLPFSFEDSNAFKFKVFNLSIHIAIFLVVFRFVYKLSLITVDKQNALILSGLAAVLWVFSPMWVSTVLYVVQRMAQLSTLFCLLGCLLYLEARLRKYNLLAIVFTVTCIVLAVLSKQNGVLLVLLVGLIELYIYLYGSPQPWGKKNRFFSFLVMGFILFGLITALSLVLFKSERFLNYDSYSFNLTERVFTELRVLCDYILSLMLPFRGGSLFFDDFQVSKSLFQPISTFISLIVLSIFFIVGICALFRKKTALLGFGILFFFLAHGLESTVIPLELYFEHRNYLPAVGLYLALSSFICSSLLRNYRSLTWFLLLLYIGFNAYWLGIKGDTWSSREKLFSKEEQSHTQSLRLNKTLATFYINNRQMDKAGYYIERTVKIYPGAAMGATLHLASAF
ncbi:MAG: hypothetical protein JKY01_10145, partial [Pseudomonadales bacterium]|nr:hypothetical protein [Pseudomonadales bacterium]